MANSFKNSYFYIGYIRRVFLSLLLCFSFGLTAELHSTLIENLEKSNEILDSLKISKKQKEDILNSLKALKENENELNELNTLSLCVENGDIKCAEKSIEKYPKLLSYKIHPYVSLLTATLIPHVDFDEKMFDFLVSKGHRIYGDDDMLPFFLLQNEAVSDEKCLEIIKKMRDDGMDLGIKMPYFDRSLDIVALDYYKPKTAAYILKNGQKSQFFNDFPLQIAIGHIMVFFRENNAGFEINLKNLKATPKSIELSKSEKYKKFIDKEFEILKVYLEANGDEKFIAEIEKIFTELNDKESLEKLEKLGYKLKKDNLENIRRQNNGK
ncbi:MAG: hypothetical protein SPH77_07840 [Campylobacter sp.]|uniref:hypothetical protein n=1 Tax=Campylobacter sp. TaxID=205 RepID=UPI002A9192A6|nr:hypothetical protein [Campylobacter sp.]MCI7500617.1 hypothetical protein [Campylobacter sp.]MDY6188726.1 hypothetical protein [Campylobacter sp.]